MYDRMMAGAERTFMRGVREEVVGGARGRVLEIGCGTGASFEYYGPAVTDLVATEPDPHMAERARRHAAKVGRAIEVHEVAAEALPFPDHAFDAVVSTLVLCTVAAPARALAEVRRVLHPRGELRFFEHVRYSSAFGGFWQDAIAPLWGLLGAGCHPNRDTVQTIRDAGFMVESLVPMLPYPAASLAIFARPHVLGVARSPG